MLRAREMPVKCPIQLGGGPDIVKRIVGIIRAKPDVEILTERLQFEVRWRRQRLVFVK